MAEELQKFRALYPQYDDLDDLTLAGLLAQKYPVYADLVEKVKQEKLNNSEWRKESKIFYDPALTVIQKSRIPLLGSFEDFLATWKSIYDGLRAGSYDFYDYLDKASDLISRLTGLEKGGIFKTIAEKVKPEDATNEKNLSEKIGYTIGSLIPTITKYMLLSKVFGPALGFAATEAIEASPRGAKESLKEGVKGFAIGSILKAVEPLRSILRIPILAGIFGGEAALETGKIEEAIPGAVIGAGFGMFPGGETGVRDIKKETKKIEPKVGMKATEKVEPKVETKVIETPEGRLLEKPLEALKIIPSEAKEKPIPGEVYIRTPEGRLERAKWSEEAKRYILEEKIKPAEETKVIETPEGKVLEKTIPELRIIPKEESALTFESLEPQVKGGKIKPLSKYAEGSAINLERIETTNDVKTFLNELTKSIEDKIGKRRVSWEETREKAEKLGWDINDLKRAWNRKGAFSAAEIEAARQFNINAISELHEMLRSLPAGQTSYTPEQRAKLLDAIEVVRITSQASSEAGRALNIHKRILARDPEFRKLQNYERVLKILEGKGAQRTDQIINALKKIDFENPQEVNRFIYSVTRTKWQKLSDGAYELWINGLLSHPLTHIVNTTSNALTLALSYPEHIVGAGIESIRAKITKTPKERFWGETAQEIFSFNKALKDGTKKFLDAMVKGEEISKIEAERRISPLPPKIQKILPVRALTAEDAFFKGFIESQELNRLAYRKAKMEGLKGEDFKNRIIELLKNPTEEMLEQAARRGQYLTYQKELGKIGNLVLRARETVPGLKYFVPFVRTPANIAKYALERSPLNIPRVAYKAATGEFKGGQLSEEIAKTAIGSLIAMGIYLMAEEGMVTGGGPKDKRERDELYRTGWQPYSFKIGDKYYSFGRLEPFGSIFGMAADFKEIMEHATEDEKYNIAAGIASSIQKNISNKTFMQGFSQISDFLSDPGRYGEKTLEKLVGSVIPAISAGLARSIDEDLREPRNIIEAIKSRIPELSKTVEAKVNIWGEPIKRPGTAVSRFISPLPISEEKMTPIDRELIDLKVNIGMPSKKIFNGEFTDDEYLQYIKLSGQLSKNALNKLVQTSEYQNSPNEVKEKMIQNTIRKIREETKNMIFRKMSAERKREVTKSRYGEYYVLR